MAYTMKVLDRLPDALHLYEKGIAIREELDAAGLLEDRSLLARIYGKAEEILRKLGREAEAQEYARKAEAVSAHHPT